ncbi:MAG TPA: DoxX family protein [Rhodothermales bacterium]
MSIPAGVVRRHSKEDAMGFNMLLWSCQVLLAAIFLFAGGMKLVLPLEALAGPVALPGWFIRFIGVAEVLGAVGLILPELLRIRRVLTPLAAAGLAIIMVGATAITAFTGEVQLAVIPATVGVFAGIVTCGRWRRLRGSTATGSDIGGSMAVMPLERRKRERGGDRGRRSDPADRVLRRRRRDARARRKPRSSRTSWSRSISGCCSGEVST